MVAGASSTPAAGRVRSVKTVSGRSGGLARSGDWMGASRETFRRAELRLPRLLLPVARGGAGLHRVDQAPRRARHLVHRLGEGRLVRARGMRGAADLPDELQR